MKAMQPNARAAALLLGLVLLLAFAPVFAQSTGGGLDKVNTFVDNVLAVLRGVSIGVVTIAVMWAGYEMFWAHGGKEKVGKILGGGLMIGSAAEIARWLIA